MQTSAEHATKYGVLHMTDENDWINAGMAIIGSWRFTQSGNSKPVPDFKPLAKLLRSGNQVPSATLDLIAELLDPGNPSYLGVKLILKDTGEVDKNNTKMEIYYKHYKLTKTDILTNISSENAAMVIGDELGISDRTVMRKVRDAKALSQRVLGKKP